MGLKDKLTKLSQVKPDYNPHQGPIKDICSYCTETFSGPFYKDQRMRHIIAKHPGKGW